MERLSDRVRCRMDAYGRDWPVEVTYAPCMSGYSVGPFVPTRGQASLTDLVNDALWRAMVRDLEGVVTTRADIEGMQAKMAAAYAVPIMPTALELPYGYPWWRPSAYGWHHDVSTFRPKIKINLKITDIC